MLRQKSRILVSFFDNTMKLFYNDDNRKIKEKITFYGHALPITDFDISDDDYVLATVS